MTMSKTLTTRAALAGPPSIVMPRIRADGTDADPDAVGRPDGQRLHRDTEQHEAHEHRGRSPDGWPEPREPVGVSNRPARMRRIQAM
jgi:hypothetical protein